MHKRLLLSVVGVTKISHVTYFLAVSFLPVQPASIQMNCGVTLDEVIVCDIVAAASADKHADMAVNESVVSDCPATHLFKKIQKKKSCFYIASNIPNDLHENV